MALKVKD